MSETLKRRASDGEPHSTPGAAYRAASVVVAELQQEQKRVAVELEAALDEGEAEPIRIIEGEAILIEGARQAVESELTQRSA